MLALLRHRARRRDGVGGPQLTADWIQPPASSTVHTVSWSESPRSFYRSRSSFGGQSVGGSIASLSWGELPWGLARRGRRVCFYIGLDTWTAACVELHLPRGSEHCDDTTLHELHAGMSVYDCVPQRFFVVQKSSDEIRAG